MNATGHGQDGASAVERQMHRGGIEDEHGRVPGAPSRVGVPEGALAPRREPAPTTPTTPTGEAAPDDGDPADD
ncbi:hypothetical protein OG756_07525 [Streptomyces sp. NBC_01310]|uniref:hypothetical protein n=1 Tax=Streptomyces sp. NBC_01310 TaxID=2903820 RepID=UPI0035B5E3A4|nr:hypothetical protein OG756_07525 [Streptomyces sp. NBC_01310]